MTHTIQNKGNEGCTVNEKRETGSGGRREHRGYGGSSYVPKVWYHLMGLPHGGGSPGRTSPVVPVGTTDKEDQWRWKCHIDCQGRQIKNTSGRTIGHQRERVLFSSTRESNPEGIYHDGSTILRHRRTTEAGQRDTRSLPDDKMECSETKVGTHKHDKGSTSRETTPRQIYQMVREFPFVRIRAVLQLSEVWPPGTALEDTNRTSEKQQKSHTKVRKLWTGTFHHQSALPKDTVSREQSKDIAHTSTKNTYNQTSQQKSSPNPLKNAWATLTVQEVGKGPFQNDHQLPKAHPSRNQRK